MMVMMCHNGDINNDDDGCRGHFTKLFRGSTAKKSSQTRTRRKRMECAGLSRRVAHVLCVVLPRFLFLLWPPQITHFIGNSTSYNMGEVRKRRENQKLQQELEGVHNEVEKMKKLISQQSLKSGVLVLASFLSRMRNS